MHLIHRTRSLLVILFSICLLPQLNASEHVKGPFALSLEELLNAKVTVASARPESIPSTPAVVSTYYMEDLILLGARSLADALSFIPGVVVDEAGFGTRTIMFRGAAEAANSQVLFLIDGVPCWSPSHSFFSAFAVPFESIDRIEVIRGPGAVIYGSNAINGVINVITRSREQGRAALTLGSRDHRNLGGSVVRELGDESWIAMSFEFQDQEGYPGDYRFNGRSVRMPRPTDVSSALVRYGNKGLHLMFQMYEETVRGRNPPTATNPDFLSSVPQYLSSSAYLAHADYTLELSGSVLKVYTDYNQYVHTFDLPPATLAFDSGGNDNYRWRSGVQYLYDFDSVDQLSLLMGLEYERRSIDAYRYYLNADLSDPLATLMDPDVTDESAGYAQLDYRKDKWRFVAGARVVDNEKAGSKVAPRASVVYSFTDDQSLKLLYAVGFRSPDFVHSTIDIPGLVIGDPSLAPETITSVDLAYTYSTPRVLFVINAYFFDADDFIARRLTADPNYATAYINADQFSRRGFEVDLKRRFRKCTLFANVAYNHEGDTASEDDPLAVSVPQTVLNVGATYDFNERHILGATLQAVSERSTTDAYQLANITYTYRKDGLDAFLSVRNITEEDPHNPDVSLGTPRMSNPREYDELNYLAGLRLRF